MVFPSNRPLDQFVSTRFNTSQKINLASQAQVGWKSKKKNEHTWTREQLSTRNIHVYCNLECWSKWWINTDEPCVLPSMRKKTLRSHIAMENPWISRPHVLTQVQMRLYKTYILYIYILYIYMWLYMWLIVTLYVYDTICWVQNYV
jgi:hypothetical protein